MAGDGEAFLLALDRDDNDDDSVVEDGKDTILARRPQLLGQENDEDEDDGDLITEFRAVRDGSSMPRMFATRSMLD